MFKKEISNKRKRLSALFLAGLFVVAVIGCGQNTASDKEVKSESSAEAISTEEASVTEAEQEITEDRVLRLGYVATNSDVLSGLNGIALAQGYFNEELGAVGASFQAIPFAKAGPAVNQALASSEIDVAGLGDVPGVVAKANNAETTLLDVQTADYSTHLVIRTDLDIENVAELKGLKVAVQTGSYMQRILYQILETNGLSPEDVEIVNMSEVDAANAIAGGSIDATAVSEQKGITLVSSGAAKLLFDTEGIEELSRMSVTVARTAYAQENSDVLVAYYKALLRAEAYAAEHPEDLRELYVAAGTDETILDQVYPSLSDYHSTVGATEENLLNLQTVADFVVEYELAETRVEINDWYDGSFYDEAKASN